MPWLPCDTRHSRYHAWYNLIWRLQAYHRQWKHFCMIQCLRSIHISADSEYCRWSEPCCYWLNSEILTNNKQRLWSGAHLDTTLYYVSISGFVFAHTGTITVYHYRSWMSWLDIQLINGIILIWLHSWKINIGWNKKQ